MDVESSPKKSRGREIRRTSRLCPRVPVEAVVRIVPIISQGPWVPYTDRGSGFEPIDTGGVEPGTSVSVSESGAGVVTVRTS
jgi:hypothetical protein